LEVEDGSFASLVAPGEPAVRVWQCHKTPVGFVGCTVWIFVDLLVSLLSPAKTCISDNYYRLVGIVYKTWITPVKNLAGVYNTRTGMGGFSDRIGAFAYALTPLSVFLSQRESILSLITGMPTQSFNFIHRWLGHIIFAQSMIHTIIWTIIEAKLYQPQPKVYTNFIKQTYMIWGIVAMGLLSFIWVFSFPRMIRLTGYEFFRKSHAIIALIYIGACWGHWNKLACWMIAALAIVFMDFGIRYIRTLLIHVGYMKSGGKTPFHPTLEHANLFQDTALSLPKQHSSASMTQKAESSESTSSTTTARGPLVSIFTYASPSFPSGKITPSQSHRLLRRKPSIHTIHISSAASRARLPS
tara:strand:- start:374 stop:1438 length:1065 start_codon:yes stop_codon:yes gene_type:complete